MDAHASRRIGPSLAAAALFALPALPFAAGWTPAFDPLGMLLVTAAALGAPGLAVVLLLRPRRALEGFLVFLLGAWAVGFAAFALRLALGLPIGAPAFAALLAPLTALPAGVGTWRHGWPRRVAPDAGAAAVAVLAFAASFLAARSVVPPLQDLDMDAQGTAYGLAAELAPTGLTDRSTLFYFAHPLLLHWFNAGTLVLTGEIDVVRPPYDAAVRERDRLPPEARRPGLARALRALAHPEHPPSRDYPWKRDVYGAFLRNPALFGTRAPSVALSAAFGALLFLSLGAIGVSRRDAGLLAVAFFSMPEVFVRSAYGGYFAIESLTFLLLARVAVDAQASRRARFAAGFATGFTSQKGITVAAALVGAAAAARARLLRPAPRGVATLIAGMVAAAAAYAVFGLAVGPEDFVLDSLMEHGFFRFAAAVGKAEPSVLRYPGPAAVWLQFAVQSGWGLTALGLGAVAAAFARIRAAGASDANGALVAVCLLWVLAGSVVLTATDWRQTKHLCTMLPALVILVGAWLAGMRPGGRMAVRLVLVVSIAWNVLRVVRMAQDFDSFPVHPIW